MPFWGFATSFAGAPRLPGPVIEATVRDTVIVVLRNCSILIPASLIFPGQHNVRAMRPGSGWRRAAPQYSGGEMISLTDFLGPDSTGRIRYRFTATRPGVHLYESGTNPENQVQMGLYGVLIVRPMGHDIPYTPNYRTAYGAGTGSRFDVEHLLVLGEVDSQMHAALGQGGGYDTLRFAPDYWMINGRCYPDTIKADNDPALPSQPYGSAITARVGQRLLLRLVNAGFLPNTMHFGGLVGRVVGTDGFALRSRDADGTYEKAAVTLGPGQTFDVLLRPQNTGVYYLRAREYNHVVNNDTFPGGMMTRLTVTT